MIKTITNIAQRAVQRPVQSAFRLAAASVVAYALSKVPYAKAGVPSQMGQIGTHPIVATYDRAARTVTVSAVRESQPTLAGACAGETQVTTYVGRDGATKELRRDLGTTVPATEISETLSLADVRLGSSPAKLAIVPTQCSYPGPYAALFEANGEIGNHIAALPAVQVQR